MKLLMFMCLIGGSFLMIPNQAAEFTRYELLTSPEEKFYYRVLVSMSKMTDEWTAVAMAVDDDVWTENDQTRDEFIQVMTEQPSTELEIVETYQFCNQCVSVINLLITVSKENDYEDIKNATMALCRPVVISEGWNPDTLCEPILDTYAPHVIYVFNTTNKTATEICTVYKFCENPEIELSSPLPRTSQENLQSRKHPGLAQQTVVKTVNPTKENGYAGALRLLHITDLHTDKEYAVDAPNVCDMPLCCRADSNGTGTSMYWGDYECNTPYRTLSFMFQYIVDNLGPDFIAYTGDSPQHTVWDQPVDETIESDQILTDMLTYYFPGIKAFTSFGNHDSSPTNLYYLPRPEIQQINQATYQHWQSVSQFTDAQKATFEKGLYYAISPYPGLRIVSYNSNFLQFENFYCILILEENDYFEMVTFLEDTLTAARANNEKVILLGHHPTGGSGSVAEYDTFIVDIQARFGDVIIVHLLGHSHSDTFSLVRDFDTNVVSGVQLSSPSGTSYTDINPSFRIIYIDPDTYEMLDIDTFHFDLRTYGNDPNPIVQLTYSFKSEYNMTDLSYQSFEDFVLRMEADRALLDVYRYNMETRTGTEGTCDDSCSKRTICQLQNADNARREECYSSP